MLCPPKYCRLSQHISGFVDALPDIQPQKLGGQNTSILSVSLNHI